MSKPKLTSISLDLENKFEINGSVYIATAIEASRSDTVQTRGQAITLLNQKRNPPETVNLQLVYIGQVADLFLDAVDGQ